MGHHRQRGKQLSIFSTNWKHRFAHGGILRRARGGRGARPLSSKEPLHLVFKCRRELLREKSFLGYRSQAIFRQLLKRYSQKFYLRIEQVSINGDHIHLLIRASRRAQFHAFFRVLAGQIAQVYRNEGLMMSPGKVTDTPSSSKLWKYRPFSRVVRSWKAYKLTRNYVQLNLQEARGKIRYQKQRLRGLSTADWQVLWS